VVGIAPQGGDTGARSFVAGIAEQCKWQIKRTQSGSADGQRYQSVIEQHDAASYNVVKYRGFAALFRIDLRTFYIIEIAT
jgi:hypothetical protein